MILIINNNETKMIEMTVESMKTTKEYSCGGGIKVIL